MILIDNRNVLRMKNRELLSRLTEIENNESTGNVIVEQAKTGLPTLKIVLGGRTQYVHSKYDPVKDGERFVSKYENEIYKYVLFVGTGLGYHINKFMEKYPDTKFSIYEPNEEVLLAYLSNIKLDELPLHNLIGIFTGTNNTVITNEMVQLLRLSRGILQIITLPLYEKLYSEQIDIIMKNILESLKEIRSTIATDASFQKRWTINSIKNFPTVLKTPNILHDIDKSAFEGKPAIIVAAGPSLNEEFENLRYIKENGLAYIFSVGSAINALIEHRIHPDAACTYDPTELNQFVIQKVKDDNIIDIPLVFGSSVGFETLAAYPGEMLHMITSQDTISPQLLDTTQSIDIVMDAPSIALVTFQLLSQLRCNPIILVGQNLGYRDNKRYAAGIDYDFVENELSDEEKEDSYTVKDVYGNNIQTSDDFSRMRSQLEVHIKMNRNIEVLNTTKGGALIEGTSFVHLDELISERLKSEEVHYNWTEQSNSYDITYTKKQLEKLSLAGRTCKKTLQNALDELKRINGAIQTRKIKNMENHFVAFDKEFNKLKKNPFYSGFVEPMVRVQNKKVSEESQAIRYESDVLKKAEVVVHSFTRFIHDVHLHIEFAWTYFEEMKLQIEEITNDIENG
ncbi:6-hydroxymethylpterin diphosphokinase MptE-like protein [Sporosarcina sp. FSL K6-6792]|uniref:motility associated factor glycosyltransferase family protein n=1 Tax=Sporosarcina sp. FSL K6-6792 TaxID=2921559 RepID=UPI0030F5E9AD